MVSLLLININRLCNSYIVSDLYAVTIDQLFSHHTTIIIISTDPTAATNISCNKMSKSVCMYKGPCNNKNEIEVLHYQHIV